MGQLITGFYEIKEIITNIYKKYEKFLMPVLRFLVALLVLVKLNAFFGPKTPLDKTSIRILSAALAAFLPGSWFLLLLGAIAVLQVFAISLEMALILFVFIVIAFLLFLPMVSEYSWVIILMPLLLEWNLGYLMPIILGLLFTPITLIPMSVGIAVYRFGDYLATALQETSSLSNSIMQAPENVLKLYHQLLTAITGDKAALLLILVFSVSLLLVHYISKVEMDYAHFIAIGVGAVFQMLTLIVGNILWKSYFDVGGVILGLLISVLLALLFQLFRFRLDYQQAQKLQFEDDHYFYYVKVIPKMKVPKATKEIKKIK